MGFQTRTNTQALEPERPRPIWRGIGCMLMILVPIISYAAADVTMPLLLKQGLVPVELLVTPEMPRELWYAPPIAQAVQFIFSNVRFGLYAMLLLTFLYIIGTAGIFSALYAFMYRIAGPKRYDPLDAPPPKIKIKKYKR